jgi:hypothetical protein
MMHYKWEKAKVVLHLRDGVFYDNYGNISHSKYFESDDEAEKSIMGLTKCVNCLNCYDCYDCEACVECYDCYECYSCVESSGLEDRETVYNTHH